MYAGVLESLQLHEEQEKPKEAAAALERFMLVSSTVRVRLFVDLWVLLAEWQLKLNQFARAEKSARFVGVCACVW